MGWECEQWFRVTGTIRPCARQHVCKRKVEAAGGYRPVDRQRGIAACRLNACGQRIFQESAKGPKGIFFQCDAGSHGMAAALDQTAPLHGASHRAAEINTCDRTSRARTEAAGLNRSGECGAAVAFL